jgi:hypothetical protein
MAEEELEAVIQGEAGTVCSRGVARTPPEGIEAQEVGGGWSRNGN